jgi:hypothetical protein
MQETRIAGTALKLTPSRQRPLMAPFPIEEIFSADFANADAMRHEALMRQSALFLRWALVVEPERQEALWAFAAKSARGPVSEAAFDSAFGMSYGELGVVLTDSRLRDGSLDGTDANLDLQLSQVRAANEEEVARLIRTIEDFNQRANAHNATGIASARP